MSSKEKPMESISWDNIDQYDEHYISYLLFQEGKSIGLISRIRNLSKEKVEQQIIQAKVNIKKHRKTEDYDKIFTYLLACTKEERLRFLMNSEREVKEKLTQHLIKKIPIVENAEDRMIALWLAGQLEDQRLLPVIHNDSNHKHGGVRRMVCSALGKIQDESSIEVLHRALQDGKPQVRQYAAKALAKIGNEKSIKRLKALLKNPRETEYVQRAYIQTIKEIESRQKEA